MECSCTVECGIDNDSDYHYDTLIDKSDFISSRETDCDECHCTISPIEKHTGFVAIVYYDDSGDGSIKYHRCSECDEIIDIFFDDFPAFQVWQYLKDSIQDGETEVPESCLVSLSPENRAKVCEFIERSWLYMGDED